MSDPITDPAYLSHVRRTGSWNHDCTCRTRIDGSRYFTCRRLTCSAEGQACGGYCPKHYAEIMERQRKKSDVEVVVLCGSTRFRDAFEEQTRRLGLDGKIVLTVACFGHLGDLSPEECERGNPVKDRLDELHKRKIDHADRVLVINVGGYIGESTRSEIEYATYWGVPIDYLETPAPVGAPKACPKCGSDDPKLRRAVNFDPVTVYCPDEFHRSDTETEQ